MASLESNKNTAAAKPALGKIFYTSAAGIFLFLASIKFGTPVILDALVTPPTNALEYIYDTWPVRFGYAGLIALTFIGLRFISWKNVRWRWTLCLPLVWILWQTVSSGKSVSPALSHLTTGHFAACAGLFYLGFFTLPEEKIPWPIWAGLFLGLCWILRSGMEQHFGGLQATRNLIYSMKDGAATSPEILQNPDYLKRVASARIFSIFSSPDTFAAAIELLLPISLLFLWFATIKTRRAIRLILIAVLGLIGLACDYWTGSKGGWAVLVILILILVGQSNWTRQRKILTTTGIIIFALIGFISRYSTSAKKQTLSVTTRFTYWKAATTIARQNPIFGTGPGTFSIPYSQIKRPSDDFARLCHNDYLEQFSDSGIIGGAIYIILIFSLLYEHYRYRIVKKRGNTIFYIIFLGVLGVALHSFVDYPLYVPSIAWPMFFLLGILARKA